MLTAQKSPKILNSHKELSKNMNMLLVNWPFPHMHIYCVACEIYLTLWSGIVVDSPMSPNGGEGKSILTTTDEA